MGYRLSGGTLWSRAAAIAERDGLKRDGLGSEAEAASRLNVGWANENAGLWPGAVVLSW